MKSNLRQKKTPLCYTCSSLQIQERGTEMQKHYTPKGRHLTIDNRRRVNFLWVANSNLKFGKLSLGGNLGE